MASTGTKLFKIASQINVGKETIVEFLQGKGFSIENKATATLTDAMVDLVIGNFQKEASAAEKQRAKTTPKVDNSDDHTAQGEQPAPHAQNPADAHTASTPPLAYSHAAAASVLPMEASLASLIAQDRISSEESTLPQSSTAEAPMPVASNALGIAVGTVIQLDDTSSRRSKGRMGKEKEVAQELGMKQTEIASKLDVTAVLLDTDAKPSPQQTSDANDKHISQPTPKHTSGETPSNQVILDKSTPPLVASDAPKTEASTDAQQQDTVLPQGAVQSITPTDASTHSPDDDHESDSDDDTQHDESGKRKRKKRIGEVFVDNAPYSTPMPTGLTILGKIDLGGPRRSERGGAPERGGNRGNSGNSGGSSAGAARGDAPRGRDAAKPRPPQGASGGGRDKPVSKPAPVVAKAKDWTKDADDGVAKKAGSGGGAAGLAAKKKRKKNKREQVNAEDVDKAIRRTLAGQDESNLAMRTRLRQKRKMERAEEQERKAELREQEEGILRVTEFITVADLAGIMGVQTNEIIVKCMSLGLMVSINQRLEKDTITLIADDYGYEVEFEDAFSEEELVEDDDDEDEAALIARAPIVTVMGHVDHGKTSLLDHIRKTSVVSGESGGITQHIGAYSVKMTDGKFITFLDTPGHQAFTAMRARGAQVTDLVVLVVAADDNVMPQTIEAISHARAANVPMVVAINKIDKAEANPDKVRQQLSDHNVLVEEWGGKYQSAMISAKKGLNIEQLLEKILLEAELLNLRANPERNARGTVVEAKIDKGKGPVATVIVQKGTLHVGDSFLSGIYAGRVRAMFNENGERIEAAIPSTPVQILGFDGVPQAGDSFIVMDSEQEAREIATTRQQIKREQDFKRIRHVTLDDIASRIKAGGVQELKIILKGDTDGSVEALADSLQKLSTPEVQVSIILRAVGTITESDIMLAAASEAVIVGFHVRPNVQAAKLAENEGVDIRLYRIIYDCINEVKLALEGMLLPEIKEEVVGVAEIREVFKISKLGNIAGCYMLEGKINRNDTVRLVRDGFEIYTGRLASLKRIKEDVREVDSGFECGMAIDGYNDIQTGDLIEAVRKTEVKRKL
ncbi:MAG: translation initiation factor IF-2 [Candidatus Kapaibacterium sp.]|nr:MAG: translation initiation factor IF-2 [Candidatus Kapabacteria bacterium]